MSGWLFKKIDSPINIVEKTTDDANADGIVYMMERRLCRLGQPFAVALFPHAVISFQAVNQMLVSGFTGLFLGIAAIGPDTPIRSCITASRAGSYAP